MGRDQLGGRLAQAEQSSAVTSANFAFPVRSGWIQYTLFTAQNSLMQRSSFSVFMDRRAAVVGRMQVSPATFIIKFQCSGSRVFQGGQNLETAFPVADLCRAGIL